MQFYKINDKPTLAHQGREPFALDLLPWYCAQLRCRGDMISTTPACYDTPGLFVHVPLFAEGSMVDTDVVQTAADRFHRWLLTMTLIVQEL